MEIMALIAGIICGLLVVAVVYVAGWNAGFESGTRVQKAADSPNWEAELMALCSGGDRRR